MNRYSVLLLILLLLNHCSLDQKTGIWNESRTTQKNNSKTVKNLFVKEPAISNEFNKNLKIKLNKNNNTKNNNYNNSNNDNTDNS